MTAHDLVMLAAERMNRANRVADITALAAMSLNDLRFLVCHYSSIEEIGELPSSISS